MIITKTPFRISFFGGGTDYPIWYEKHRGAVLSTTINKYCYISTRYLPPFFKYKYRIRYSFREETQTINKIKHPAVKACLKFMKIKQGIEMVHTSDIPARSGVGSSSAFTVGFLNSLYALTNRIISKQDLALNAIQVEQDIIKEPVGSQDQAACAFGGFNKIEFCDKNTIHVQPITVNPRRIQNLEKHLMLFFTGYTRISGKIAAEQIRKTKSKTKELYRMYEMVDQAIAILSNKSDNLDQFGTLLNETWQIKRTLTHLISNPTIDATYDTAKSAGAIGGKLLGAGGGGFLLLYVPVKHQPLVKAKLKKLLYVPFNFETIGSQIILYAPQDFF